MAAKSAGRPSRCSLLMLLIGLGQWHLQPGLKALIRTAAGNEGVLAGRQACRRLLQKASCAG